MKSLLPIIVIILGLTAAITYSLAKRAVPKREENRFGIAANELETGTIDSETGTKRTFFGFGDTTPTPTLTITPTLTPTPTSVSKITPLPAVTEGESKTGSKKIATESKAIKIKKNLVCTPVYGQANTCTEHIVVDTGAEDTLFFNFAGLTYLAGLVSFVKAKSLKS